MRLQYCLRWLFVVYLFTLVNANIKHLVNTCQAFSELFFMENHIGNNIKRIAEEKNLKPQEIAYRWKKTPQAVYDLYAKQFPKADAVIDMSRVLKVSALEILGITENYGNALQENAMDFTIYDDLRNQLKVKDQQIEFLQGLIKKQE
jgi:hypothetical protein